MLIAKGSLQGCGRFAASGDFTIEAKDGVLWFRTSEAFMFEGAPAPGFAISSGGASAAHEARATDFLRLPGTGDPFRKQHPVSGSYSARLPGTLEFDRALLVFLWCYDFHDVLAVGRIEHVHRLAACC